LFKTIEEAFGDYRTKVDVIERVITLNSTEDSKPRKKSRGGKRNIAMKQGLCWLKAVPKKLRETAISEVGYHPTIEAVSNYYLEHDIVPRNLRVEFIYRGAHMKRHLMWPSITQWSIISVYDRARRIGADIPYEYPLQDMPCCDSSPLPHEIAEEESKVRLEELTAHDLEDQWDDELEDAIAELSWPLDHFAIPDVEPDPVVEEMIEIPTRVGGPGDCWLKLPCAPLWFKNDRLDVTVEELLAKYRKWNVVGSFAVKAYQQEDGD
jgi:hypothetical protein